MAATYWAQQSPSGPHAGARAVVQPGPAPGHEETPRPRGCSRAPRLPAARRGLHGDPRTCGQATCPLRPRQPDGVLLHPWPCRTGLLPAREPCTWLVFLWRDGSSSCKVSNLVPPLRHTQPGCHRGVGGPAPVLGLCSRLSDRRVDASVPPNEPKSPCLLQPRPALTDTAFSPGAELGRGEETSEPVAVFHKHADVLSPREGASRSLCPLTRTGTGGGLLHSCPELARGPGLPQVPALLSWSVEALAWPPETPSRLPPSALSLFP